MQDSGFPSHVTTTTTTTTTTSVSGGIRFDPSYVKSPPGIIKLVCIALNLIGFICIMLSVHDYAPKSNWFSFVAMGGFWITVILLLLYSFHIMEKLHFLPILKCEFGYCALWTLFYFTAAVACAVGGSVDGAWAAAAFFGFAAMIVYGVDAFFKFKAWRSGQVAQGERAMATTSSTVTSPAY